MLNVKQKKCIEYMVDGSYTQKEIAGKLNVTENTISNWKKNKEFMAEYNDTLKSSISEVAAKAFKTQIALLKARSEIVRYSVSKDILDRAGFKPSNDINLNVEPVTIVNDLKE